jgi:[ribosomal protein S5]-alanine N-acetyltransferase
MFIETPRLIIRDFVFEDLKELAPILADPLVMAYSSYASPFTWEQTEELLKLYILEAAQHELGVSALIRKDHHDLIGYCGIEWHQHQGKPQAELVFCLGRTFWRQGFASEAATAVKSYAMDTLNISPLVSFIRPGNGRSIRLAEKLGASLQGTTHIHNTDKLVYLYEK